MTGPTLIGDAPSTSAARAGGVTVLVATYNRARYLDECLHSILSQSIAPAEVIVIDDGSTDSTPEVVARHAPRVRYLRQENGGKSRALNRAMPEARGDYIWIFDDDDVALPDSIAVRLRVLESRPEIGFVVSGHYLGADGADGRIVRVAENRLPDDLAENELRVALMRSCFVTMQSMLVRADALRSVGAFDVKLARAQDYDMMLRLAAQERFALLRAATFIFRRHAGARGPARWRHEAGDRQRLFRQFDAIVGHKLRAATPLGDYLVPPQNGDLLGHSRVQALLERAVVMAGKGLVAEALDDIEAAQEAGAASAGNRRTVCRCLCKAICTGYAYDAIASDFDAFVDRIRDLRRGSLGRGAAVAAARAFATLAKSYPGSMRERFRKLVMAAAVMARAL